MSAPLGTSNVAEANACRAPAGPAGKAPAAKPRTVEQTYQKLTQLEHILLRPDTYIGSVEAVTQQAWVYDRVAKRMAPRTLTYVPGLYKIFDEILVNAADNKQRDGSMDTIKVEISRERGTIAVYNNGQGIPVEIHKEHGCYVPELVFGHLLTSSNYDDDEQKVTGGRNGYGAKLANIFSTEFIVETSDCKSGLQYKQTFSNNMRARGKPTTKPTSKADWTRITFTPDLAKFGMAELDEDICALMARRVVDLAGCTDRTVKVYLDGERVPVADFKSYVDLYIGAKGSEGAKPRVYEKVSERWEVCVAPSDDGFAQVSFVNSIATTKGGKHVDHVVDQLVAKLMEVLKKKDKSAGALKPHAIKGHLSVFINCLIVNAAFDSQTKEHMTLVPSKFGSKCELDDKFLKQVAGCGVVEAILEFLSHKNQKDLAKTNKGKRERLTGISKLDDANEAGGRRSRECTLILTEGDSAKALAVSGLSVIGRDFYGVFPLRGKLLNVREAAHKTVMDNAELTHIKQIMGLQHGKKYTDDASLNTLRYGHLMIMTDQDHDGSHIKGLVINYLHVFWPELLQHAGFLQEFVTPIVKASKARTEISFFTLPEYDEWREAQPSLRGWNIKYYKGLGTSTSAEAKEYFSDLDKHELTFEWQGEADGLGCAGAGGDAVDAGRAAAAPVLLGWAVVGRLGRGHGVDRRHQPLGDAEVVVDDLGDRREAVGRARRVGDDLRGRFELLVVDAHDDGRHLVGRLGGGGDEGFLCAGLDVLVRAVEVGEEAGRLDDVVHADVAPLEVGGVALGGGADGLAVDDEVFVVGGDFAVEAAVDRVVLEEVGEGVVIEEVVDADHFDVGVVLGGAEDEASDASKAIDTDLDSHRVDLRGRGLGWKNVCAKGRAKPVLYAIRGAASNGGSRFRNSRVATRRRGVGWYGTGTA